jgi:hypothetical protein
MLWTKIKVGQSVCIGEKLFTLVAEERYKVVVVISGVEYTLTRDDTANFETFTVIPRRLHGGLTFGFQADSNVPIVRL